MKIGEITNSEKYQMDEQNQNLPIFGIIYGFPNWKKQFQILQFRKSSNFHYWPTQKKNNQSSEIVEFQKLVNFKNLTIRITIRIQKISNLMVNYQICVLSVRII